jgi:deoxycytidine triphosphate deaminase
MQVSSGYAIRNGFVKDKSGNDLNVLDFEGKSSIDVTIGEIISHKNCYKTRSSKSYSLEPQETVYIISNEILEIPIDHVAYVFLKNRLSQQGILAFNTGIIDGGYRGVISTLITNLSLKNIKLDDKDNYFFRVVFHEVSMTDDERNQVVASMGERGSTPLSKYRSERSNELMKLPKYFLDRDGIKKQINKELDQKAMNFGVVKLSMVIALVAIMMAFVPVTSKYLLDEYDEKFVGLVTNEKLKPMQLFLTKNEENILELSLLNKKLEDEINLLNKKVLENSDNIKK